MARMIENLLGLELENSGILIETGIAELLHYRCLVAKAGDEDDDDLDDDDLEDDDFDDDEDDDADIVPVPEELDDPTFEDDDDEDDVYYDDDF